MSNRFTDQLLAIEPIYNGYILYEDVEKVNPDLLRVVFDSMESLTNSNSEFTHSPEYYAIKQTIVCLIAAMSDEDIDELIINYKE